MKIAINQPTYLPWMGYFDLIDQVSTFVFLDSVQFEKRSWQQRNRIKGPDGLILLTVPANVKGRLDQQISDVSISDVSQFEKHLRSVEMNYRRCRFFGRYWRDFSTTLEGGWNTGRIVELNITLIRWCMRELGLRTPLLRSSEIPCTGKRSELLARICEHLGADYYLSVPGSAAYLLEEDEEFKKRNITVGFQHYEHPAYDQQFPPFVPYTSVIDLIFNLGDGAIDVLRSGRRSPISLTEMKSNFAQEAGSR
jgi:hypothetical protein